jgi:hypothetical protein
MYLKLPPHLSVFGGKFLMHLDNPETQETNVLDNLNNNNLFDEKNDMKRKIENIKFPSVSFLQTSLFLQFIIGFLIPVVGFQIALFPVISNWEKSIIHLHSFAALRFLIFSSSAFGYKFILENLSLSRTFDEFYSDREPLGCFGRRSNNISIFCLTNFFELYFISKSTKNHSVFGKVYPYFDQTFFHIFKLTFNFNFLMT